MTQINADKKKDRSDFFDSQDARNYYDAYMYIVV